MHTHADWHVVLDRQGHPVAVVARWSDAQEFAAGHRQHGYTVHDAPGIGIGALLIELLERSRPTQ